MNKKNYACMPQILCTAHGEDEIKTCKYRRTHLFSQEECEAMFGDMIKKGDTETTDYYCTVRGGTRERPTCNSSGASDEALVDAVQRLNVGYLFKMLSQDIDVSRLMWG